MIGPIARGDIKKLADFSGLNATTVSRIIKGETKNPGVETMAKINAAAAELGLECSENADEKQKENRKSAPASAQDSENAEEIQCPSRDRKAAAKAGMGA